METKPRAEGGNATASEHAASFRPIVHELEDYVPGRDLEEVAVEFGLPLEKVVKMASNESPFSPSPDAVAAIPSEFGNLNLYPWKRFTDFKEVIAEFYGLEVENIVLGNGSESLISMVPHLYMNPGDEVVLAAEGYPLHESASMVAGAVVKRVPLRDFRYDIDDMLAAVTERTKIMWICSPINPTGTMVKMADLERLLAALPATVAVVVDGAYAEYVDDPDYGDAIALVKRGYPNVIALRTLSKAYGLAGLRIGYLVANPLVCNFLDRLREPFNMSRAATAAGPVALHDQAWLRKCQEANRAGRTYLTEELTRLGFDVVPSETNFVLVGVPGGARELYQSLIERGIIVRPTAGFGYPGHVRITVGTVEQNERLIAELKEILAEG